MKKLISLFICIIMATCLSYFFACNFSEGLANESLELSRPDLNADGEISVEPNDTTCAPGDSCTVINQSCCEGEKIVAINEKSYKRLSSQRNQNCFKLLDRGYDEEKKITFSCDKREIKGRINQIKAHCKDKKCEINEKTDTFNKDAEIKIEDEDSACNNGDECVAINKGCCPGEKLVAVNLKKSKKLEQEQRTSCTKFFSEQAKNNIHDICKSRQSLAVRTTPHCSNKKCELSPTHNNSEITLEEKDIACTPGEKCVVINKSCCEGEKEAAINSKSLNKLNQQRQSICMLLFNQPRAEGENPNLCEGREVKKLGIHLPARCVENKCTLPKYDAEISPGPADFACKAGEKCLEIDRGCCAGEKPTAVNQNSFKKLTEERNNNCKLLFTEYAKENIFNICLNRSIKKRIRRIAHCVPLSQSDSPSPLENKCVLP